MLRILYFILCYVVLSCTAFRCDNQAVRKRATSTLQTWPDNTVPYEITNVFDADQKKLIDDSLKEVMEKTGNCVKFVPRTDSHPVWVSVLSLEGCWSAAGLAQSTGAQQLSLDRSGCLTKDTIQHEFLHALGFVHEQTRPDRDAYVKILYENVEPKMTYNFDKDPQGELQSFGLPYDYNSIMHYAYDGFSTNCLPTIVTVQDSQKQWRYKMGTGSKLTDIDIYKIKKMYNCAQ